MTARLNYCWRLLATGFCFSVFGLGGLALWTFVFPAIRIFSRDSRKVRIRYVIHKSFGLFLRLMEFVGVMKMQVEGAERLADCGRVLVLANHPTLIDVVAMISLMPRASCVVKQTLWKNPFLGGVVRAAGYISNSDSDRLIDECADEILAGYPMLVFPEGTRSADGVLSGFQRGAAYIALRSGMPVLPVLINSTPSTLTKREKWYQIPCRRFDFRIKVMTPVRIDRLVDVQGCQTVVARRLTRAFETYFNRELAKWKT
ncbi:MAG: 1-acyl-sn-glycerol-3-phosphate acyltransferase [Candidatus Accumulibacter sp.]|jgi:1-acyl-sn-glycerol-3-phosphate acyltransferase|nr:1-acyl-sn-glycerol-3-phosphate acyltransferase [Accumulibacter sp.]